MKGRLNLTIDLAQNVTIAVYDFILRKNSA